MHQHHLMEVEKKLDFGKEILKVVPAANVEELYNNIEKLLLVLCLYGEVVEPGEQMIPEEYEAGFHASLEVSSAVATTSGGTSRVNDSFVRPESVEILACLVKWQLPIP